MTTGTLLEALSAIPDHRTKKERRFPAISALDGLTRIKDFVAFDAAVKALPDVTKAELSAFETALLKRLGPNVSAGDHTALASLLEQLRKGFEAVRETLKSVSRVVDTDRRQCIRQERLAHGQKKDKGISR